jgi:AbiTii-like protein
MQSVWMCRTSSRRAVPLSSRHSNSPQRFLKNLELGETALSNIALKTARLARLLNDSAYQLIMEYEAGGYPSDPDGVPADVFQSAVLAGRKTQGLNPKTNLPEDQVYLQSINELEEQVRITEKALLAATDPDDSSEVVGFRIKGNHFERLAIRSEHTSAARHLATSRASIYRYVLLKHYELKFSGIADDVFTRIRLRVDSAVGSIVPEAVKRLTAIYENLRSENPEDWSNAVHGCRRVLQDLADAVFPATNSTRAKRIGEETITINLGKENYINRLAAFVDDRSSSERFNDIVGSQLAFLGDRLDAIFRAAQKGSHSDIVQRKRRIGTSSTHIYWSGTSCHS